MPGHHVVIEARGDDDAVYYDGAERLESVLRVKVSVPQSGVFGLFSGLTGSVPLNWRVTGSSGVRLIAPDDLLLRGRSPPLGSVVTELLVCHEREVTR